MLNTLFTLAALVAHRRPTPTPTHSPAGVAWEEQALARISWLLQGGVVSVVAVVVVLLVIGAIWPRS
jgi:hypothetical protein